MKSSSRQRALELTSGVGRPGFIPLVTGRTASLVKVRKTPVDLPALDGIYGSEFQRDDIEHLVLVVAGAADGGAPAPEESFPTHLAAGIAANRKRPVRLVHVARTGHTHNQLHGQYLDAERRLDGVKPDLVFLNMGDDARSGATWKNAEIDYRDAVDNYTSMGAHVVWGAVPPTDVPVPLAQTGLTSLLLGGRNRGWERNCAVLFEEMAGRGYGVSVVSTIESWRFPRKIRKLGATLDPTDPVHPGNLAQRIAADQVVPYLLEALDTPGNPHPRRSDFDTRGIPVQGRQMSGPTPDWVLTSRPWKPPSGRKT